MSPERYVFPHKHLLGIGPLSVQDITAILDQARAFEEVCERPNIKIVPALRKKLVVNLFFENSTRTRNSFEIAEKRLSAEIINFDADTSSLNKGETLMDTAMNLQAMHPDLIVMRHCAPGAHALLARHMQASIVNAGDGAHEHPTQALLDAYTLRKRFGRLEGLKIAIVGDIRHSRVARSQITAYAALGAEVTLVAPATLLPPSLEGWPVAGVSHDLDGVLATTDVISLLRLQAERGSGAYVPTMREYSAGYALTARRALQLPPEAIILHPGPMVRGVEIASEVAELPSARITDQVGNGVAVRMAVLFLLLGQGSLDGATP